MAFNEQEQAIIRAGLSAGKTRSEVETALSNFRLGIKPTKAPVVTEKPSALADVTSDIAETGRGVVREFGAAGENIVDTTQRKDLNIFEKALQAGSQAFRGAARGFGEVVIGAGKVALPQETEEQIGGAVKETVSRVSELPQVQDLLNRYNSLDPETKRNVDNALGYAEGLAEIITGGTASRVVRPLVRGTADFLDESKRLFASSRTFNSVDDLVQETAQKTVGESLDGAMKVNPLERFAGLSPDVKKRISGKQDKLREYFDVAHARNADDTVPTPYEFASLQVDGAVKRMDELLNETGGEIGATRQRLGTIRTSSDSVASIEKQFIDQLAKLNLEVRGGVIRPKAGTVLKVGSNNDINVLNDLYQEFRIVKQNPSLTNLIDFRSLLDQKINFGRQAREVSGSVDPVSRQLRKTIADEAAKIVGKSEAEKITQYSEFIDAYNDLRSYADRRAGGEYLLRLVLSGRGGEARRLIETIKKHTGIDLMDDATMMTLATDVIGNSRQKNLFRQEITNAGLDAARALSGDPTGVLGLLSKTTDLDKVYTDFAEKIILEAAK